MKFRESALAHELLDGLFGLEIGGSAHNAFGLWTKNVDFTDDLNTPFKHEEKTLCGEMMPVDIVAFGDALPVPDESHDFVISSHVLEHFPDPIKALKEWTRVVKKGGYIYMIVPHKERTFDKDRERTTLDELIARHAKPSKPGKASKASAAKAKAAQKPYEEQAHFSVWITADVVELVEYLGLEIVAVQDVDDKVGNGFTVVVRKGSKRSKRGAWKRTKATAEVTTSQPKATHGRRQAARKVRRLAIFAHYDPAGEIRSYIQFYMRALRSTCDRLVFVSTASLTPTAEAKMKESGFCDAYHRLPNVGYDFWMWKHALAHEVDPTEYDEIVLANSSVFGPIGAFAATMDHLSVADCDFWGITESLELAQPSIQSYFLVFKRRVIQSQAWRDWWAHVEPLADKWQVILRYEGCMAAYLRTAGFKSVTTMPHFPSQGRTNPCFFCAEHILMHGGHFVKISTMHMSDHGRRTNLVNAMAAKGYDAGFVHELMPSGHVSSVASVVPVDPGAGADLATGGRKGKRELARFLLSAQAATDASAHSRGAEGARHHYTGRHGPKKSR